MLPETKEERVARIKATMASYNNGTMLRKVLAQGDAAVKAKEAQK